MLARSIAGFAVHVLTASGAVCGLIALHHAALHDWMQTFLWLGAAAIIDAVDGPIARKVQVELILPRFSGARLDLVVDYLNYCVVPAFIVMESGRAGADFGLLAGAVILLSSLFHFADSESKTKDGFFNGFPTLWNVVCLYFFVFDLGHVVTLPVILALAALTFIPMKWVHPVRVHRWRGLTLAITLIWAAAALHEVIHDFPGTLPAQAIFVVTAVYFLAIGVSRTLLGRNFGEDTAE
jgi:phosphatidylcholine synthase